MSEEKTEAPTPKKLRDARKKGTVVKSADLISAALLLAMIGVFQFGSRWLLDSLHQAITIALGFCTSDRSPQALSSALMHMLGVCAMVCGPISLVGLLAAAVATLGQVGVEVTFTPVIPKLSAISPGSGMKRIFSKKSMIDLVKMTLKAIVLAIVLWQTIASLFPLITGALYEPLPQLAVILWSSVVRLLMVACLLYLLLGAVDWKIQHWLMMKSQRMSKDELKRERKSHDGDPKIKSERKKRAKELIKGDTRPAAVSRSSVVVVNPTHYAVALRYAPHEHALPVVLAKGVDADALEIRRLAAAYGIPIVANPPVARALHRVELDSNVPEDLFEVVAAILRWVQSIGAPRGEPGAIGVVGAVAADPPRPVEPTAMARLP
ncbi:type III secretion system export apparatus subunit SctU [Paraburkholderia sediminicola]|uniref:Type III secretion system export apparatus subunit SctU n=1 Tax=Paraburkholderia metrosideri TaxID=580937 RepID=A0ABW9DPB6_9BURK